MVKMSLVTVQRSPSGTGSHNTLSDEDAEENINYEKSECFFTGKGTALILALREIPHHIAERRKSLDAEKCAGNISSANLDIQQHLQSMFYLLRHEDTLKMAVKLESQRPNRTRYLAIVSRTCYKKNNGLNISSSGSRLLLSRKSKKSTYQRENEIQKDNNKLETTITTTTTTIAGTATETATTTTVHNVTDKEFEQINRQEIESSSSSSSLTLNNDFQQQQQQQNKISTTKRNCDINVKESSFSSSRTDPVELEESCLLGIDCNERKTTIGLVLKVLADTTIRLDGDGGFSVSVFGKTHIFKPVSVQAMWSALQTLHKVSQKARDNNFYPGGPSHEWVSHYEERVDSDRSCLNEWNAMDNLESRRPPSPDAIENKPTEREETKQVIRMKLKEIMMSVDLDEVTSKYIRSRLEEHLDMDLGEYKSFIDEEMLMILGQMDAPTEIFEHVYLGSEWNASNLEELQRNGVGHILNVTREIDNFFPGMFNYFNVRVYDDEKTNLLKHWDNTYKYISRVKAEGSKVLVHCKMGVSRSASVVIAYAMKAYNWDFNYALQHVKERRNCVKPNKNFLAQLETYRGMLDAMQNKEKLQRSKSETNLKTTKDARLLPGSEPTPLIQALNNSSQKSDEGGGGGVGGGGGDGVGAGATNGGQTLALTSSPSPLSSPSSSLAVRNTIKRSNSSLSKNNFDTSQSSSSSSSSSSQPMNIMIKHQSLSLEDLLIHHNDQKNVRYPGTDGQNYSLTQNQIRHIQKNQHQAAETIVDELETQTDKMIGSSSNSNNSSSNISSCTSRNINSNVLNQCDSINVSSNDVLLSSHEILLHTSNDNNDTAAVTSSSTSTLASSSSSSSGENLIWTSSSQLIRQSTNIEIAANNKSSSDLNQMIDMSAEMQQQQPKEVTTTATAAAADYFSSQLDNIFENEETKTDSTGNSSSNSSKCNQISNQMWTTSNSLFDTATVVSRQSSCSSVDSAVFVGGYSGEMTDIPSRQSSWGSGDNRILPSRNSSWGSYDTNRSATVVSSYRNLKQLKNYGELSSTLGFSRGAGGVGGESVKCADEKDESISSTIGTVKRTKQKLEENASFKKLCDDNYDDKFEKSLCQNVATNIASVSAANSFIATASATVITREDCVNNNNNNNNNNNHQILLIDKTKNKNKSTNRCNSEEIIFSKDIRDSKDKKQTGSRGESEGESVHKLEKLSASAPETFSMEKFAKVIQQQSNNKKKKQIKVENASHVQNLKKNFEAKASLHSTQTTTTTTSATASAMNLSKQKGHQSLPSSPIASHSGHKDLNVRDLVTKYQSSEPLQQQRAMVTHRIRPRSFYESRTTAINSDLERTTTKFIRNKKDAVATAVSAITAAAATEQKYHQQQQQQQQKFSEINRPPPVPPIAKIPINHHHHHHHTSMTDGILSENFHQRKVQHYGKTHPLARLSFCKKKLNAATYNTM